MKPKFDKPCILTLRAIQYFNKDKKRREGDATWTCELQGADAVMAGHSYVKVKGLSKKLLAEKKVKSGVTTLSVEGATIVNEGGEDEIVIPANASLTFGVDTRRLSEHHGRKLQSMGDKSVLVVRVNAKDKSTSGNETWLSQLVFGGGAYKSLKDQYEDCSYDKLKLTKAGGTGVNSSLGTTTVSISDNVNGADIFSIETLIDKAVQTKVGLVAGNWGNLNNKFKHVIFCVPDGTLWGGGYW